MATRRKSRFEAKSILRLASLNASGRVEMQFSDASGKEHTVSLPSAEALALGRLICDIADNAPYIIAARTSNESQK